MSIKKIEICSNGAIVKLHNRKVFVIEVEDGFVVEFVIATTKEEASIPASIHKVYKNKVRLTGLKLNKDTMHALCLAYSKYLKSKSHE